MSDLFPNPPYEPFKVKAVPERTQSKPLWLDNCTLILIALFMTMGAFSWWGSHVQSHTAFASSNPPVTHPARGPA